MIYFMADTIYKYVVNNTNIKIKNGVLFVTAGATILLYSNHLCNIQISHMIYTMA